MMRKFIKSGLGSALAMLVITPGDAQTNNLAQTPENAHKFIQVTLLGRKFENGVSYFSSVNSQDCQTKLSAPDNGAIFDYRIDWSTSRPFSVD